MKTTCLVLIFFAAAPLYAEDALKSANIQRYYTPVRNNIEAAAEAMPEAQCGFKIDATFAKLDDQKILSSPQMVTSFLHTTVHNNEIYWNIVGYLRANGITPPSTAARRR
jgi:hypothetical protein